MIPVDGHVHVYDCFEVATFLSAAATHFRHAMGGAVEKEEPVAGVLLLTEGKREKFFSRTTAALERAGGGASLCSGWRGNRTGQDGVIEAVREGDPADRLFLVAGRQVVTRERIEVLGLFCPAQIPEGMELRETIDAVRQAGGVPVLPWGVGKWRGRRGRLVREAVENRGGELLCLGDNGGRPWFQPTPALLRFGREQGVPVLPGSDPLPLPGEESRVGRFGFLLRADGSGPAAPERVREALRSGRPEVIPYGRLQTALRFFLNQARLRMGGTGMKGR
ncbi:MAG: hypothetical protein Kow0089_00590 [Desulfobulbaceae bacterium]